MGWHVANGGLVGTGGEQWVVVPGVTVVLVVTVVVVSVTGERWHCWMGQRGATIVYGREGGMSELGERRLAAVEKASKSKGKKRGGYRCVASTGNAIQRHAAAVTVKNAAAEVGSPTLAPSASTSHSSLSSPCFPHSDAALVVGVVTPALRPP